MFTRLCNGIHKLVQHSQRKIIFVFSCLVLTLGIGLQWNVSPAEATSIYSIPRVTPGDQSWVLDQATVLSRLTQTQLESQAAQLSEETGIELRFVTFRRLDYGETVETFADKLFESWFADPETQAEEAVFVIDVQTNNGSFHLGSQAQDRVSQDAIASIINETLVAPLRAGGKYNQALADVSDRITTILRGEPDPGPPVISANFEANPNFATAEETKDSNATTIVIVLLIIATVVPMLTYFAYVR